MKLNSLMRTATGALLTLFGSLTGCNDSNDIGENIILELGSASERLKVGQELEMVLINKGEWSQMFVFTPYTPLSDIESSIKLEASSDIKRARVGERDDINLLVFVNGENIQAVAAVPREVVDFSVPREVQPLSRSTAVFEKTSADGPLTWARNSDSDQP